VFRLSKHNKGAPRRAAYRAKWGYRRENGLVVLAANELKAQSKDWITGPDVDALLEAFGLCDFPVSQWFSYTLGSMGLNLPAGKVGGKPAFLIPAGGITDQMMGQGFNLQGQDWKRGLPIATEEEQPASVADSVRDQVANAASTDGTNSRHFQQHPEEDLARPIQDEEDQDEEDQDAGGGFDHDEEEDETDERQGQDPLPGRRAAAPAQGGAPAHQRDPAIPQRGGQRPRLP
jgi:hypothetical protein